MQIEIDHLRTWIGREQEAAEQVTPALVARFNATFDRRDEGAAGASAPLMLHFCLAAPAVATDDLAQDGHPAKGDFLPPVPLPRRMWAGGSLSFTGEISIGDLVTRRSRIADVTVKEGRSGTLCFVAVEHTISAKGRTVVSERQDIVYRASETAGATAASKRAAAPQGDHIETITPSPPLLFRYSALTFNSHRIHYDEVYTRGVEGYPGLVVHGPLQATLLARYAESLGKRPPAKFSFRSLSPLYAPTDFTLNATFEGDNAMKLWTANAGGPVAMEARAEW